MKAAEAAVLFVFATVTSACAPMFVPAPQRSGFAPVRESPVGRWDAVMALEPPALVGVVTSDGVAHTGRFVRAGMYWLRLFEKGTEVEIPRDEVARVDLLGGAGMAAAKRIAGGAAGGALVAGGTEMLFALLFAGKLVMPGRTMAIGAAGGAVAGAVDVAAQREPRAIYISPQLVR